MEQIQIKWDQEKNLKLQELRGVSFEEIAALIEADAFYLMAHPVRENQQIAVVMLDGYPWDVPFVIEKDGSIFLKTAFPNRRRK